MSSKLPLDGESSLHAGLSVIDLFVTTTCGNSMPDIMNYKVHHVLMCSVTLSLCSEHSPSEVSAKVDGWPANISEPAKSAGGLPPE